MSLNHTTSSTEQMELLPQDELTFPKNIALANPFGLSNPTLRKQNCLHALQYAVREQFMLRNPIYNDSNISTVTEEFIENTSVIYDIPEEQIMANLGYLDKTKYYSLSQVLDIFEEIANESLGFDSYGIVKSREEKEEWTGFSKVIASVERKNGCFRFTVPPKIVHRIVNPRLSFNASIDWQGYKSKYSPSLYETCMYYYQNGEQYTDWLPVDKYRTVSGTTYKEYSRLKERVIKKALENINTEDSLELHVELEETFIEDPTKKRKKVGKKPVTHIRFRIKQKIGAILNKSKVKSEITLASQKTELRTLGIASNQVDGVLDEIRDEEGNLVLPYLSWCIRRGHELISFKEHSCKELNMFGGYFRINVIRGCKEDWLRTNNLVEDYVTQHGMIKNLNEIDASKKISEVRELIKSHIAEKYIRKLSEKAFVFFKEEFLKFLEDQLPSAYEQYMAGQFGNAITDLDSHGKFYLNLFLDHKHKLFTYNAYEEYLSSPDNVF